MKPTRRSWRHHFIVGNPRFAGVRNRGYAIGVIAPVGLRVGFGDFMGTLFADHLPMEIRAFAKKGKDKGGKIGSKGLS
jgi:hypothetical protein